jgi:hypothetical protein
LSQYTPTLAHGFGRRYSKFSVRLKPYATWARPWHYLSAVILFALFLVAMVFVVTFKNPPHNGKFG